jgi:hypothetical protein
MRKVGALTGLEWIRDAVLIVRAHPRVFLLMGLFFTSIPLFPLLGPLVLLLLGPALMGGMIHAAREAEQGRVPRIGDLFLAFREGDRIGSFMALCLPIVGALIVLIGLAMPVAIKAINSGAITHQTLSDPVAVRTALEHTLDSMGPHRLFLLAGLAVLVMFVAGMMTFLASACVMLGRQKAFSAIRASFKACAMNLAAFLIAVLVVGVAAQGLHVVLAMVLPDLLAAIIANIPYYAIFGALSYTAYRSIFGDHSDPEDTSNPPQPETGTHTFEA